MCGMEYRLKKGSVYECKVEKVDFPNKATVWVTDEDGQKEKAIVKNAIPGQTVRFCVNKKRKGHCEGRLMEVVEKSPLETNPACPHFGKCGGCTYQTVAYKEQLKIKSTQVEKLLREVVSGELPFEGIIGSPVTEEYRNKMEFSFGDEYKDGPLALGLHKRNSMYDIVPVTECKIIDEDYRKILTCVQDYAIEKELPFQHKLSHEGYLRHLLVRKSVKTGQILVDIVTTTQIEHDFTELVNRLTSIEYNGTLTGVLHTFNDSLADAVINEKTELLYGQDYIEEELLGLRFKITPFSFFQRKCFTLRRGSMCFLADLEMWLAANRLYMTCIQVRVRLRRCYLQLPARLSVLRLLRKLLRLPRRMQPRTVLLTVSSLRMMS